MWYYRSETTYPSIFKAFFDEDGYELVEKDDHKKKRLKQELEGLEARVETLQSYLVKAEKERKIAEDELKKLK